MTDTLLASVASWVMSEILSQLSLAPLRSRFVYLPFLNVSSIDGLAAEDRKIRKRNEIAEAVADAGEAVAFTAFEEYTDDTPITLTPTGYIQGVRPSVKSIRRSMPGARRDDVVAAIQNGSPEALPMLRSIAEELIQAHYKKAERTAAALASGASTAAAGTTNTALDFAALIDGQTALLENKPEHRALVCILGTQGIGDLRSALIDGDAADSQLFGNGIGEEFLNALGGPAPTAATPFGNILGMPIYEADDDLLPDANGTTDKLGAIFCAGRGETTAPGSLRGFAEFCEGHNLAVQMQYDLLGDVAEAIGRYEWDLKEHTDEHIVGVLYKAPA